MTGPRQSDSEAERLLTLEINTGDHSRRIGRLETSQSETNAAIVPMTVAVAVLQRDVRVILWIFGATCTAVIAAIVAALSKILGAA